MVYRATENIRNEDIYGFVDRIGGRWTGGTGSMATTYGETVPSWALEEALRITAERMGRARFDSTEFERERSNVATEANGFSDTGPAATLRDAVMLASFEVHPYRYSSNTWVRDNLRITRRETYDFYRRFYGPNNAVLTIVGDVAADEAYRLVEQHFGPLPPAPETGGVKIVEPPQRVQKRVTLVRPVDTQRVEIVYRAPPAASPDYPVLVVLDRVLHARLERSLAEAGAGVTTSHRATPYPWVYRISVATSPSADLEHLVRVIEREIERLGAKGVGAGELAAAKTDRPPRPSEADECDQPDPSVPPRAYPGLTEIARELDRREVLPWEVGSERLNAIRRAQADITSAGIRAYVDRWLRPSQRTVGLLVAGPSRPSPEWSDGLTVERLEMPAMTVPPAKRANPTTVPPRALEPLAPLSIETGRRALANGVSVRAARKDGDYAALRVRFQVGSASDPAGKEGLSVLAARLLAGDPALSPFGVRAETASIANHGFFDIDVTVSSADLNRAVEAVARALDVTSVAEERVDRERARLLAELAQAGGARESPTVTDRLATGSLRW